MGFGLDQKHSYGMTNILELIIIIIIRIIIIPLAILEQRFIVRRQISKMLK